jgi:hypothetical protein
LGWAECKPPASMFQLAASQSLVSSFTTWPPMPCSYVTNGSGSYLKLCRFTLVLMSLILHSDSPFSISALLVVWFWDFQLSHCLVQLQLVLSRFASVTSPTQTEDCIHMSPILCLVLSYKIVYDGSVLLSMNHDLDSPFSILIPKLWFPLTLPFTISTSLCKFAFTTGSAGITDSYPIITVHSGQPGLFLLITQMRSLNIWTEMRYECITTTLL